MHTLMTRGCLGLVWLSVVAAVVGFVLPWATLDVKATRVVGGATQLIEGAPLEAVTGNLAKKLGNVVIQVKRGAETVTGKLPDLSQIPTHVNGPQIPQLVNRQDAQVVLALAEMLTGERQVGAKSYVVYLVPGLAILCGILVTLASRVRVACLLVGVVCVTVAGVGFWKLLTAKTETLLVAITIGQGLWLSLWAYVGLGVFAMVLALLARSQTST